MRIRDRITWAPEAEAGASNPSSTPPAGGASPTAPAPSGAPSGAPSSAPSTSPGSAPVGASAPSTEQPVTSAPGPSGVEPPYDFSAMFEEPPEVPIQAQPPAPLAPVQTAPETPPAQQPVAQPPVQAQPEPGAPPVQSPDQQGVAGQPPALDPADPLSLARGLVENRAAAIDHLAQSMFQLSPEDVEALETNTVGTIPKLLARAVVESQIQFMTMMARQMPLMLQRHEKVVQRHEENLGKFFARWPDLKKDVHGKLVLEHGVRYRQMYPQATLEQMIEHLGPIVMAYAGVVPQPRTPAPGQPPVRPTQPPPFVPAQPGAIAAIPQTPEAGVYDYLGQHGD